VTKNFYLLKLVVNKTFSYRENSITVYEMNNIINNFV